MYENENRIEAPRVLRRDACQSSEVCLAKGRWVSNKTICLETGYVDARKTAIGQEAWVWAEADPLLHPATALLACLLGVESHCILTWRAPLPPYDIERTVGFASNGTSKKTARGD